MRSSSVTWESDNLSHQDANKDGAKSEVLNGVDLQETLEKVVGLQNRMDIAVEMAVGRARCASLIFIQKAVAHPFFNAACSSVILLNTVFLVGATQYNALHFENPDAQVVEIIDRSELGFVCWYSLELILKLLALRLNFVFGEGWAWNTFDLMLVGLSLFEVLSSVLGGGQTVNLSYLRVIRLMKMLKLLRFIRLMRQFHELRMVLDSILGSMKCMLWSIVLIATVNMMFSLCFVQAATEALVAGSPDELLVLYWGSVNRAMISLFWASTGGADWSDIAEPMLSVGWQYYAIFMIYISFFIFVIMNSLTSIFVDSIMALADSETQDIIRDQMERKQEYMNKIVSLFKSMDADGSGEVSYEEFQANLRDPNLAAFAASLGLEANDLEQFFNILSAGGKRSVDLETFVVGCIKLRGPAKSMDVTELLIQVHESSKNQEAFTQKCDAEFRQLQRLCAASSARPAQPAPAATAAPKAPVFSSLFDAAAPGGRDAEPGPPIAEHFHTPLVSPDVHVPVVHQEDEVRSAAFI